MTPCSRCGEPAQVAVRGVGTTDAPRPMCMKCVGQLEEQHQARGRQVMELWDAVPKRALIVVAAVLLAALTGVVYGVLRLLNK